MPCATKPHGIVDCASEALPFASMQCIFGKRSLTPANTLRAMSSVSQATKTDEPVPVILGPVIPDPVVLGALHAETACSRIVSAFLTSGYRLQTTASNTFCVGSPSWKARIVIGEQSRVNCLSLKSSAVLM